MTPSEIAEWRAKCKALYAAGWYIGCEIEPLLDHIEKLEWAKTELSNQVNDLQLELQEEMPE